MNKWIDIKINYNYFFAERIKKLIIQEKDIEKKVLLIEYLADYYSCQVTGKYSDEFLEEQLIDISNKNIIYENENIIEKNTVLHVMSECYSTGGHTRAVNNWINLDEKRKNSIIFTNQVSYIQIPKFLKDSVENSGGKIYFTTKKSKLRQAIYLQSIASNYEKIILHVHMFDSIPLLAFGNHSWNIPIYFYGHADFRFWLGVSISDVILDIHSDSKKRTINLRGAKKSIVFPLPNEFTYVNKSKNAIERSKFIKKYDIPQNAKIITTIGSDFKYTVTRQLNFQKFIKYLVNKYKDLYVIVIGPDAKDKAWKNTIKSTHNRVKVLGVLNKDKVDEWLNVSDIYLDSFPVGGGVAILDALNRNLNILSLSIKGDRLDELMEIKSKTLRDLDKKIKEILLNNENKYYLKALLNIKKLFSNKIWINKLDDILELDLIHKTSSFHSNKCISNFERIYYQVLDRKYEYDSLDCFNKLLVSCKIKIILIRIKSIIQFALNSYISLISNKIFND